MNEDDDDDAARAATANLLAALAAPISSLDALVSLLKQALALIGDADSQETVQKHTKSQDYVIRTQLYAIQKLLATTVFVSWATQLDAGALDLWKKLFTTNRDTRVALSAYAVLVGILAEAGNGIHPNIRRYAVDTLDELVKSCDTHTVYRYTFRRETITQRDLLDWQSFVSLFVTIPARVANAYEDARNDEISASLQWRPFFCGLARSFQSIVSTAPPTEEMEISAATQLLSRICKSGFVTPSSDQLSFWTVLMPSLRCDFLVSPGSNTSVSSTWNRILASLTTSDLLSLSSSFFAVLQSQPIAAEEQAKQTKCNAVLASCIFGSLSPVVDEGTSEHLWTVVVQSSLLERTVWDESTARTLVAWAATSSSDSSNLERLLTLVSETWCSKPFIQRTIPSSHYYLSAILVLIISSLPACSPALVTFSRAPIFISAISTHLSSLTPSVRLSGMYIAQLVSQRSLDPKGPVKPLDFSEIWQMREEGYEAVERLMKLAEGERDWEVSDWQIQEMSVPTIEEPGEGPKPTTSNNASNAAKAAPTPAKNAQKPKIQVLASDYDDYDASSDVDEDDADLKPYSLPSLPPTEELKDLEDLSTYTPNKKKVKPPVYIPDLAAGLKSSDDAEKLDIALKEAEALIRRKATWGTELSDGAVDLAITLTGLQDNFNLKEFENRRRDALTALMVCAPRKAAPAVIEHLFSNHYSMNQRFAVLSSLALGARELAGLPSLLPRASSTKGDAVKKADVSFPTQKLPPKLHAQFMASQEKPETSSAGRALDVMTEDITKLALSQTRQSAEQSIPGAAKEKLLTVRQQTRVLSKSSEAPMAFKGSDGKASFANLAVDTFIMPLINRFWLYLRDISTSPQDRRLGPYAGGGAGTAPLLEPMMLSKYLQTLCVLLNAAKNSPHFLAVLGPETLELVLSLRSLEATSNVVQESMMQLVLVVLDTSTNVDGGRTLARDFSRLTWQVKDWAEDTWKSQEQSGKAITQAGKAAAGVLLRINDVVQKTIGYR